MLRLIGLLSRDLYRPMFASWPHEVREPLIGHHLTPASQRVGALERSNQPEWRDELKASCVSWSGSRPPYRMPRGWSR
jgi:hypothetical protein